jgi:hypothetical protein
VNDSHLIGFCQRYLILPRRLIPRRLIKPNQRQAQHKIKQQPFVGLLHQIVQSNPFLAHKYTPSKLEGPYQYFVILKWLWGVWHSRGFTGILKKFKFFIYFKLIFLCFLSF